MKQWDIPYKELYESWLGLTERLEREMRAVANNKDYPLGAGHAIMVKLHYVKTLQLYFKELLKD